jgi:hypothetical protein
VSVSYRDNKERQECYLPFFFNYTTATLVDIRLRISSNAWVESGKDWKLYLLPYCYMKIEMDGHVKTNWIGSCPEL